MLSLNKRKAYFKALGLGEYNKASILKLQKKYFTRAKDCDGVYGNNTDLLLRHVYNVETYTKNFSPSEFKCGCGGRHCTGYPTYMKPAELKNLQTIRDHYNTPITITCGLRCKGYNASLRGSVSNSLHLKGQAIDFYMAGHTDTLTRRKNTINYIRKLANHNYAYGNGYCSGGYAVSAPNMGNAIHFDTQNNPVKGFATRMVFKVVKPKTKTATEKCIDGVVEWAKKYEADNRYKYKKWTSDPNTHRCPICHPESGKGWNCIGFVSAAFHHGGGVKSVRCNNAGLGNNAWFNSVTADKWRERNGKDWLKVKTPKKGDVIICYSKGKYVHTALYIGNGYIIDATSARGIKKRPYSQLKGYSKKFFRYTGKGKF